MQLKNRNTVIGLTLFTIAFLERVVFDLGANVEAITAAVVVSSFYLKPKQVIYLTFLTLVLTDLIIGNTNIFFFTWSGFLIPALVLPKLFRNSKLGIRNYGRKLFSMTTSGLVANIFFFFHTNLGVWLFDSWGMYEKTSSGLVKCYINALPFLKNQMLGTFVFIPITMVSIKFAVKVYYKYFFSSSPASERLI